MIRVLRIGILLLLALVVGSSPAFAAFAPGCANPADSALNQYCEVVPGATGGQPPQPGKTAALATALAHRVVGKIAGSSGGRTGAGTGGRTGTRTGAQPEARRALLGLPAAGKAVRIRSGALTRAGTSMPPAWLVVVLAAVAVALTGAATARWRHLRDAEPPSDAVS